MRTIGLQYRDGRGYNVREDRFDDLVKSEQNLWRARKKNYLNGLDVLRVQEKFHSGKVVAWSPNGSYKYRILYSSKYTIDKDGNVKLHPYAQDATGIISTYSDIPPKWEQNITLMKEYDKYMGKLRRSSMLVSLYEHIFKVCASKYLDKYKKFDDNVEFVEMNINNHLYIYRKSSSFWKLYYSQNPNSVSIHV